MRNRVFCPQARLPCNICRSPCRPLLRAALPATPVWLRLDSTLHQNRGSGTVQLELKLPVQERVSTRVPAPLDFAAEMESLLGQICCRIDAHSTGRRREQLAPGYYTLSRCPVQFRMRSLATRGRTDPISVVVIHCEIQRYSLRNGRGKAANRTILRRY